jgi:hypothetical protein
MNEVRVKVVKAQTRQKWTRAQKEKHVTPTRLERMALWNHN